MRACRNLHLILVAFFVVISSFGSSAQPMDSEDQTLFCNSSADIGGPCHIDRLAAPDNSGISIQSFKGTAQRGGESHQLRLNIENVRSIDPAEARMLLQSNASIEEIRSRIRAENRASVVRGNLRLDSDVYQLINITAAPSGNKSVLDADLSGPIAGPGAPGPEAGSSAGGAGEGAGEGKGEGAGHITVTLSVVEGTEVGEGTLNLNGDYVVSLYQFSGRGPGTERGTLMPGP